MNTINNIYEFNNGTLRPLKLTLGEEDERAEAHLLDLGSKQLEKTMPFLKINNLLKVDATQQVAAYYDIKRAHKWAVSRLYKLRFNTMYSINNGGFEVPEFAPSNQNMEQFAVKDEKMYEAGTDEFDYSGWGIYLLVDLRRETVYVIAISKTGAKLLPIPNQYDSGKMCMGGDFRTAHTLGETMERVVNHLLTSSWNTDLYGEHKRELLHSLIQFKNGVIQPITGHEELGISKHEYVKSKLIQFGPSSELEDLITEIQKEIPTL